MLTGRLVNIMNIISKLKRVASIGLVFGVFAAAIAGVSVIANHTLPVEAATSCDRVNVIYCGISGTTTSARISSFKYYYDNNTSGHSPAYHDVQTIYNYVGASKSLVDSMSTANTVHGLVYKNGNVTVNGVLIATNAMSVGRFSTPGSSLIPGTNAYLRYTTASFANDALSAIIRLDGNGNMIFGVMLTCGNAFKATPVPKPVAPIVVTPPTVTPTPTPDYTVVKEVAVKGDTTYAPSVTVNYGTHVVYRITVTNTGSVPVTSLGVYDTLPASVKYVNYTIKHDGADYATSFFSSGIRISSLANGTSTNFTYEVVVGPNDTATSCTPETVTNTASTSIMAVMQTEPNKSSTAKVYKTCIAPVVPPVTPPATVIYVPSTTVVIAQVPVAASCTNLTLSQSSVNPRIVTATVAYSATSGVTLNNISFNWSDGNVTNNGIATSAQHTYLSDGNFNILATLNFSYGSTNLSPSTCQIPISFGTPAAPQVVVNQVVAQVVSQVVAPTTPAAPAVPIAKVPPVAPATLANTGPGSVAGLFAGVSAIGAVSYRFFLSRRLTR